MREADLQSIYVLLIGESVSRLDAASEFLDEHAANAQIPRLEAAILQVRKALELVALAAIAPDKKAYAAFRATAEKDPDYTRDYHAAKIFAALSRVNADFYPKPLAPAERQSDGTWHYGDRQSPFLSKKKFERSYDRLGKHLHAHNPWSGSKNLLNLGGDLPRMIEETRALLELHARFIRTPEFQGVWVVRADSPNPQVITAVAQGPYVVQAS
jgi:hypothetical protein